MPTSYPPAAPTITGNNITVDRLMNSPVVVQRLLRTLVQQRLIGDKLLAGRVDLTGSGTAIYEIAESIFPNFSAERVAALAEYPLTPDALGTPAVATADKWGLATEFAQETVARNRFDVALRKLTKLANQQAYQFDAMCLSAVSSAVTQTQPAGVAWTSASATQFLDVLLAIAQADELNQGYTVDTIVLKPSGFARLLGSGVILAALPREGNGNPILTGNLVQFAGLNFLKSTNLPAGVAAMVLDSTQLGSIAYEEIGGPNWQGSAAEGVQSKTFELPNQDGWRTQTRLVRVPMVQEPGAAVKITGTGL